ncbi:MAG: hypothetical protein KDB37_13490 [Ilumatobacter sp.]|nr:hypothetical protein [Ilumatobacter sp.]
MNRRRSLIAAAVLSLGFLTACGTAPPPADELAHEMIDAANGPDGQPLSEAERDCMHAKVDDFELTPEEEQGFSSIDDVFEKASEGQDQAIEIVTRFQTDLATCRGAG